MKGSWDTQGALTPDCRGPGQGVGPPETAVSPEQHSELLRFALPACGLVIVLDVCLCFIITVVVFLVTYGDSNY